MRTTQALCGAGFKTALPTIFIAAWMVRRSFLQLRNAVGSLAIAGGQSIKSIPSWRNCQEYFAEERLPKGRFLARE